MILQINPQKNFRNESIKGQFDIGDEIISNEIKTDYDIPNDARIILIVGGSGTGKTQLIKHLFKYQENEYRNDCSILNIFPENIGMEAITNVLTQVGLSTPKLWLHSYNQLSNGQRARFDIAFRILTDEIVVIDEFTSLVDRDVAFTMCKVIEKLAKKMNKQFVLSTCHYDVKEFIEYDCCIDTNECALSFDEINKKKEILISENAIEEIGENLASFTI